MPHGVETKFADGRSTSKANKLAWSKIGGSYRLIYAGVMERSGF
jgi:hypothetical protein